jgi:hypothetical protein
MSLASQHVKTLAAGGRPTLTHGEAIDGRTDGDGRVVLPDTSTYSGKDFAPLPSVRGPTPALNGADG